MAQRLRLVAQRMGVLHRVVAQLAGESSGAPTRGLAKRPGARQRSVEHQHARDGLLSLVFGLALLGLTGYGYGYDATSTPGSGPWIMPFPAAVAYAVASLALLLEDRRFGLGRLVCS